MTTLPHPLPNGHFRALREHLGLTTQWVAEQVGFNHRTVRRWDNGESAVPPRVVTQLHLWKEQTDAAVDELVLSHQQRPRALTVPLKEPPPAGQPWPPRWYRHVAARAADQLPDASIRFIDEP